MALLKFLKGNYANLGNAAISEGQILICGDTGEMFVDVAADKRVKIGDFITVANLTALEALDATKVPTSRLYYVEEGNILARSNGTSWVQVNKQPSVEELKTLLGLSDLAYKSEVAEGDLNSDLAAKINAASGAQHTHSNESVLNGITAEKVSAWDAAEQNAKDYADDLDEAMNARVEALEAIDHEHANQELLDTYTQTEANLADAVAKKHSHNFADEAAISAITAAKVAEWDDAVSKEHTHTFADADVVDAISKKHSHTFVESELNKIAAGDVAKWNGVVADHLTAADKTAIEDSIGDVNTALENYKTSNNEALAGVKATADAAATKEYADAELAKKVNKTDYEADKATFATKTELGNVDAKFADYNTKTAQKAIDDAQDAEIAKKVDKVDGKDLIATSEIERLATLANYDDTQVKADIAKKADAEAMTTELGKKVDKVEGYSLVSDAEIERLGTLKNYDDTALAGRVTTAEGKITDLETESAKHALKADVEAEFAKYKTAEAQKAIDDEQDRRLGELEGASATHATKDELAGVDAKFADYTKTADLPTDLGDFTNNAGYAKTADVNAELAKKADKTQVATDIANAIAPLATTEALNGVKEIAEAARTESEVDGQIDAKIAALNIATTYEPIGAEQRAKAYADGLITDANLDQYTTEQEVKDIVDTVIAGAVDGDTITGLANLVEYLNTHGAEAKEMGAAIDVLEGKVETIEGKPAYGITATQISNWDNEVGAKALAETKTTTAEVKDQIEAYGYATTGELATEKAAREAADAELAAAIQTAKTEAANQDAVVLAEAQAYADQAKADAIADAASKYETSGTAQSIVNALKLGETYEPIGAEDRAIAAAKSETEAQVGALAAIVYTKEEVYTKAEVENLLCWGEF